MTNNELLKIAQKHLGQGGARFRKFAGLPSGAAWCNAFVDYVASEGGVSKLYFNGKKETYCPHSIKWCKANLAELPLWIAMPMDIIYFDWDRNGNPNHIGFVRGHKSTSSIYTIEGNTDGGKVAQKTRNGKYIQGIYRPHFPTNAKKMKLKIDGDCGYNTIYNVQAALGMKPTGIFTKETVKMLQKKCGASQDGAWGASTSKHLQTMLRKAGCYDGKIDGEFGASSTNGLQRWANKINYPAEKAPVAKKPTTTPTEPKKSVKTANKGFTGQFPTPNTNAKIVNGIAYRHCWPYGTPQKKYTYKNGKPTQAYKKGIDKAYPKHKSWPNKKQKVGACCDVFVGEVLGNIGIKVKKDLKNQLVDMPKMTKQLKSNGHYLAKDFKAGDVVQRGRKDKSGHTWIVCELANGTKYVANAHYKKLNGTYAVMDAKPKNIVKSKWKYYKCYTVLGALRKYYMVGDYGKDVKHAQEFLKWYGSYKGSLDGDFGTKTEEAVKKFQKAAGLSATGRITEATIAKMKVTKK